MQFRWLRINAAEKAKNINPAPSGTYGLRVKVGWIRTRGEDAKHTFYCAAHDGFTDLLISDLLTHLEQVPPSQQLLSELLTAQRSKVLR
jgi:hypothetical protein